jgi:hypothetical protein
MKDLTDGHKKKSTFKYFHIIDDRKGQIEATMNEFNAINVSPMEETLARLMECNFWLVINL